MKVHCVPINDEKKHPLRVDCWCNPDVDYVDPETGLPWASGGIRVVHLAADCREFSEQVTGEAMAPDKKWEVVTVDE